MTTQDTAPAPTHVPGTRVTISRIVQYIVDGIVLALVLWGVGYLADRIAPGAGFDQLSAQRWGEMSRLVTSGGPWPSAVALLLTAIVWAVVFVAFPIWRDRTPGMMLLGLQITRLDGGRPSALQHVARALFLIIDGAGGGFLGWLVIVCSRNRQRIGDHAAGTLVVRR